ncbi:MAG: hypothetical protein QM726_12680 [Chitinophagaceae bacterium]
MRLLPLLLLLLIAFRPISGLAQDTAFKAKHAAILFPYPMYTEKWRSSIGLTLVTTPEDITEEVRLNIPCGDFHLMRRVNDHLLIDNRLMFQVLQNHVSTGLHYMLPLSQRWYLSAGDDIGFWFGFLKVKGFNSSAAGWLNYPGISIGYKTKKDLLISFKAQTSFVLHYQAANGDSKYYSNTSYYNGETFTIAIEQPFYNRRHLTLAFSTINNYFFWQTWALFYQNNRKIFYPQVTVGLIL